MAAANLVSCLYAVRETGVGRWIARCPAHDDRAPSLSIREVDGRTLIHCFSGCEPLDIVHALGLQLSDLFIDSPPVDHRRPRTRSQMLASDALACIDHETSVVSIIAADMLRQREIDEPTWRRLAEAVTKIGEARSRIAPSRRIRS